MLTLYKLYAVPVRVCSTREDMHYPWVISSVPVSHILSTREGMHYPWVISSVPVSHILSTREDMQYPWHHSTREDMTAYPHGYWGYDSRVLRIWLTGTAYPHGYWGYDSRVLRIWLTGTAYIRIWLTGTEDMTHGYWGYDSQVLMIWLTGNAYPHGYCIPSRVLHIVYTGWCSATCTEWEPLCFQFLRKICLERWQQISLHLTSWSSGLWSQLSTAVISSLWPDLDGTDLVHTSLTVIFKLGLKTRLLCFPVDMTLTFRKWSPAFVKENNFEK